MTRSPHTLIQPLAKAGVKRFTFQYEVAEGGVFGDFYWGEGMNGDDNDDDDIKYKKSLDGVGNTDKNEEDTRMKKLNLNSNFNEKNKIEVEKNVEKRGAIQMAVAIRKANMLCGVCIAPNTTVAELEVLLNTYYCTATGAVRYENGLRSRNGRLIESLNTSPPPSSSSFSPTSSSTISSSSSISSISASTLWEPLIDYVDLLAVMPGVGGQRFDHSVLEKVNPLLFLF